MGKAMPRSCVQGGLKAGARKPHTPRHGRGQSRAGVARMSCANACLQSGEAAGMVMLARAQGFDCCVQPWARTSSRRSGCHAGTARTRTGWTSARLTAWMIHADTLRKEHLHEACIA